MAISIIAAMTPKQVIGVHNQLPWHLPADLKHFKELTLGKPIVMGRKTFESIGKALPGRENIVLTQDKNFSAANIQVMNTLEDVLMLDSPNTELIIIGGANIYKQFLPYTNKLYFTIVHADIEGDAYFPEWKQNEWDEIYREEHPADEKNAYAFTFVNYVRRIMCES